MKTKIKTDLYNRYSRDKDAFKLLNTASYLDPRFHRLIHLERDLRQEVREKTKAEISQLPVFAERAAMATGITRQEKTALSAMGDLFGDVYRQGADTSGGASGLDIGAVLDQEMLIYESETPLPTDSNPLSWWKTSRSRYPHLAELARRYLRIPGTSVRAERVFSTAGIIVNKKRSALDSENVDLLVFLANNLRD
ncbi:hypothetical protein R3I94_007001 [Phoxinus phoxinus]